MLRPPLDRSTEFLLESGANVNKIGYEECTPLMYEVYMKNHDTARLFIERGADVNYQRQLDGFCSLHFSAQKRDADTNSPDATGRVGI